VSLPAFEPSARCDAVCAISTDREAQTSNEVTTSYMACSNSNTNYTLTFIVTIGVKMFEKTFEKK